MKNNDLAYHEAGHFIYYLINCKRLAKAPHEVKRISIIQISKKLQAYVEREELPYIIKLQTLINSDIKEKWKEQIKIESKYEIQYLLAGIASEVIVLNGDPERVLSIFYRAEKKDVNSDLSKAVSINTVLGNQNAENGVLPLLKLLEETIKEIREYWNEVDHVSKILQEYGIIEGDNLERLKNEISSKLRVKSLLRAINR